MGDGEREKGELETNRVGEGQKDRVRVSSDMDGVILPSSGG